MQANRPGDPLQQIFGRTGNRPAMKSLFS